MTRLAPAARLLLLGSLVAASGCGRDGTRFRLLDADRTGVDFANTITTSDAHSFLNDAFIYNGAGVAVGDVNGDGRPDLYLSGNMVSSRLYLNRGDFRFEDVTEQAGVATRRWATGASFADVDGDGDLDLYVSVAGPPHAAPADRANLLFMNRGDGTFTEEARRRGVADTGFTTHAVFLDYDRDGFLDLYLLGNSPGEFGRGETGQTRFGTHGGADPAGFDQLYRNDGDGTFTNVSERAGILRQLGYGLGVVASDVNGDGWPDLYVSNDIATPDVLYVNNRDGTFTDRAAEWLGHTSFAGMGIDVADFTDDGWPDIYQNDMVPEELAGRKRISGSTSYGSLLAMRRNGGALQYNVNTLQWSRGATPDGRVVFSEIARIAGVAYTNWSWSALLADFDNDGRKDLFVSNGYPKAVNDFDYQTNGNRAQRLPDPSASRQMTLELQRELGGYELPNYLFRNEGDLTFSDRTEAWGLEQPGYSYGAAYVDLNDDGRLDLVVNNIDAPASIYQNVAPRRRTNHYLAVRLEGQGPNRNGVGAKLVLTAGGRKQYLEQSPYRGFMSTVDDRLHFGLGAADRADALEVIWPDGRYQRLTEVAADRTITLRQRDASGRYRLGPAPSGGERLFHPVEPLVEADSTPRNPFDTDYSVQPLLPYQLSSEGPPIAVADVDGDGLEDVFLGGGDGSPGRLLLQQRDGGFREPTEPGPWAADPSAEDRGALFFDADGDRRPDLYVARGGYTAVPGSERLQDRLYLNRGQGRFSLAEQALPPMRTSTAAVAAADYDGDGRLDLFVGGRLTPRDYPRPTRSYVLHNDGGRFTDVTARVAPALLEPGGMITDAVWTDFTGDGRPDLVTAGEWMPVQLWANDGTRLEDVTADAGLPPMRGWWYSLAVGDLDGDGRPDLVAGNLGLNHSYTTSDSSRFGVYAGNFSGYRENDLVFTQEIDGTEYPYYGRALLGRDNDLVTMRYPTYAAFADASAGTIFGAQLRSALHYQADTFASVWLHNEGGGRFTSHPLPDAAQIAPIRGILVQDVDGDGKLDLVTAGNLLDTEPNTPPADAGKGLVLRGDGRGHFRPLSPTGSGFLAPLDARDLARVATPRGELVLVANHDGPLQAFLVRR